MEIKEYKIIPFAIVLLILILPSWFDCGAWIKDFFVPYINFYVEDISDELIKLLLTYVIWFYLKSPETKNFVAIIFMYWFLNCFVVFTDYLPYTETYKTYDGLLIYYNYDLFDNSWKVLKGLILSAGIIYFINVIRTKYKVLMTNHKLN